jgi:hypothetical protein
MTKPTCGSLEKAGNLELSNIPLARRLVMSNAKTLELRTLEDDELLDVVGGCETTCHPERCYSPCGGGLDVDIDINVFVGICL